MKEKTKKMFQILISILLFIIVILIDKCGDFSIEVKFCLYLIPYLVSGYDIIIDAFKGLIKMEMFDECFLMCIATFGAFLIGFLPDAHPEFIEAICVMVFFQIGELFEIIAEDDSERSINSLIDLMPNSANLEMENGKIKKVKCESLRLFDTIVIKKGEKVPVDGEIIEGETSLNTSFLTGEAIPRVARVGDNIMSGCINEGGLIKLKVMKTYEDSTASKIIDMVENSNEVKSNSDRFITKFARVYTPLVVLCALILALVPPIFDKDYVSWINRSLSFLIVSCPCALVVSVPLSYFGGIGAASKKGILIKGAKYLEDLSKVNTVAFDKTGTLTKGNFEVVAIHPNTLNEKELLHLTMHVESFSTHPIAVSLKEAYDKYNNVKDKCKVKNVEEIEGLGIKASVNNEVIYVGNEKLMDKLKIKYNKCSRVGSIIYVASEENYYGHIVISDQIKDDSYNAVRDLTDMGIKTYMLTGDSEEIAKYVAGELRITKYYAALMPKDKVKIVSKLEKANNNKVIFVGDGVNDAPVLSRSNLGVSMGGIGSDIAIESSSIVIMDDKVSKVIDSINISKKVEKIVKENIIFALLIKFLVLGMSLFGAAPMIFAIFADVGVTILAILNALRTLKL